MIKKKEDIRLQLLMLLDRQSGDEDWERFYMTVWSKLELYKMWLINQQSFVDDVLDDLDTASEQLELATHYYTQIEEGCIEDVYGGALDQDQIIQDKDFAESELDKIYNILETTL